MKNSAGASAGAFIGLTRSEEFWFPDGNIVIVADKTAFRVYRGLLALQSTVFADLFTASSPRPEESYEDCPAINLTDSPQDVTHLLRVLVPTSSTPLRLHRRKGDKPLSFDQLSSIIRLAHKYHLEDLLSQALSALQYSIPSRFKMFEHGPTDGLMDISDHVYAIGAVNLARLTDTPSILPLALYICCTVGAPLIDGWKREDGTVEFLSPADLKRCITGRTALARESIAVVLAIFQSNPSIHCTTPSACEDALRRALSDLLGLDTVAEPQVLDKWEGVIHSNAYPQDADGFCSSCESELVARDVKKREDIWNRLPQIFDVEVPHWNQGSDEEERDGGNSPNGNNRN